MEACKNFRPATRSRLAKIQKQNNPKTPRRLSGEMRAIRRSQARLDKSLEKLAVSLSKHCLLGRSISQADCNRQCSLNPTCRSEKQRQNVRSCHGDLENTNPSILLHSGNLKMIPETVHDTWSAWASLVLICSYCVFLSKFISFWIIHHKWCRICFVTLHLWMTIIECPRNSIY